VRAVRCEVYGLPSSLVVRELPDPQPDRNQAVVAVEGSAINFPDSLFIQNKYQMSLPLPFTPGSEFAGVVLSVGSEVDSVSPGDRVMGSTLFGAYAEQIAVPAASLHRVPAGLDSTSAAAFQVTFRTAYHALRTVGGLESGQWAVILGAAGGVGTAAVDIAARLGARVVAVDRGLSRLKSCLDLGAAAVVDTETEDLKLRLRELTGAGADVVIDPVGGNVSEPALRSTCWGGRFVVLGFASGDIPSIALNLVLLKGVIIRGFQVGDLQQKMPIPYAAGEEELSRMVDGGLRPVVDRVVSLEGTADGMIALLNREVTGKVVINPRF
jgi:NADPH2:quinone reductase